MSLRLCLLSASVLAPALVGLTATAHADVTKYSCRAPTKGPIEAIIDDNACVGYRVKAHDGSVSRTVKFPFKGSGKLSASDDGRTVVMLQSYLPGSLDAKGNIVEGDNHGRANPIAIRIFRDGALIQTHHIDDLLVRKKLVSTSISHVSWLRDAPAVFSGPTFTITTTSFRSITFDTKTGALRKTTDSEEWKRCDDIIVGNVDLAGSQLVETFSLKTGKRTKATAFIADPGVSLTNKASTTACLEQRDHGMALTQTL